MKTEKQQSALEWFFDKIKSHFEYDVYLFETTCMTYAIAKEMEKEQRGYSEEDVIKIVEKSRETGLTAEYLLLTFKQQEQ